MLLILTLTSLASFTTGLFVCNDHGCSIREIHLSTWPRMTLTLIGPYMISDLINILTLPCWMCNPRLIPTGLQHFKLKLLLLAYSAFLYIFSYHNSFCHLNETTFVTSNIQKFNISLPHGNCLFLHLIYFFHDSFKQAACFIWHSVCCPIYWSGCA